MADDLIRDPQRGKNTQHELTVMLWQAVDSWLAGYEDTNDAERLALDPAMRQVIGGRAKDRRAVSRSQMGRLETEILTTRNNVKGLMDLSGTWSDRVRRRRALDTLTLDVDSPVSETYPGHVAKSRTRHTQPGRYSVPRGEEMAWPRTGQAPGGGITAPMLLQHEKETRKETGATGARELV